jgi:hypothetical protein
MEQPQRMTAPRRRLLAIGKRVRGQWDVRCSLWVYLRELLCDGGSWRR